MDRMCFMKNHRSVAHNKATVMSALASAFACLFLFFFYQNVVHICTKISLTVIKPKNKRVARTRSDTTDHKQLQV